MRVERRGRCSVVSHTSLDNLMEKVVVQETCIAEDHKFFKAAQPKSGETLESEKRTWDQSKSSVIIVEGWGLKAGVIRVSH